MTEAGGAAVVVPPGAVASPVTIRIAKDSSGAPGFPEGLTAAGEIYAITPHGATFDAPVEVRIPVPSTPLQPNERWSVAKAEPGGQWGVLLNATEKNGMLVAPVQSFSFFAPVKISYALLAALEPLKVTFARPVCQLLPGTTGNAANCNFMDGPVNVSASWTVTGSALPSGCTPQNAKIIVKFGNGPNMEFPVASGSTQTVLYPFDGAIVLRMQCTAMFYATFRVGFNSTATYPAIRVVQAPDELQVVDGTTANVDHVFNGGAAKPSLNGSYAVPTETNGAVTDWERSDDGGRSWSKVAQSFQYQSDSRPYGQVAPAWAFWGVRHGFVARLADNNALFRSITCYTPPDAAAPPCVTRQTKLIVLQQSAMPTISSPPRSVLVKTGETASFSASAGGAPMPTLQWQTRDANSNGPWLDVTTGNGATTGNYTTAALNLADNGREFRVVVTNAVGTASSAPVTVSVSDLAVAPSITTQPASLSVTTGNDAVFAIAALGTEALSYQWFLDGSVIAGANSPVLRLTSVSAGQAGSYMVRVSNAAGNITSNAATLTVSNAGPAPVAPSIVTQPVSVTVNAGNTATFAVGATGTAPLTYQWLKNGQPINGATAAYYSIASAAVGDVGSYSVQVTNGVGAGVTSTAATLTVNTTAAPAPVAITTQPSPQVQAPGGSATFAVAVTGTGPISYQWLKDGSPINGATSGVLIVNNVTSNEAGSYAVTVSNGINTVTSNGAALIVLGAPAITSQPAAASAIAGQTATFSISASGSSLLYQWTKNGVAIAGATASSYTTPVLTLADSGAVYAVVVYNGAGLVFSAPATLTVAAAPPPPPGWSAPDTIAAAQLYDAAAGIDGARRSFAIWPQSAGLNERIVASRGAAGSTWGAGATIDNAVGGSGYEPQLGVAAGGQATAIWGRFAGGRYGIAANRFDGAAWGVAEVLDDAATGNTADQRVAVDASGRAAAVWQKYNGTRYVILVRLNTGGAWLPAVTLDPVTTSASQPQVAVNAQGRGFVSYIISGAVVAAPIDLGAGSVGAPVTVATAVTAGRSLADHRLAVDAGGGAVLAWIEDMATGGYDLRASRFLGAGWSAPDALATNVGFNRDLGAAAGAAGETIVAWIQRMPNGDDIAYSRRYVGAGLQPVVQHTAPGAQRVDAVQVAMNAAGRIVIAWTQRDATDTFYQSWAQVYSGSWGTAQPVQPTAPSVLVPRLPLPVRSLALGDDGAALLIWLESGTPTPLRGSYLQ